MTETQYGVVLVTASSQEEAQTIARSLVTEKLAACVSLFPIQSIYTWEGELHTDEEWQLVVKTDLAKFAELEAKVAELHSYAVPEIIALAIAAGSDSYLAWMGEQTNGRSMGGKPSKQN
jgi:periplasmic divalent cation tolerance protein